MRRKLGAGGALLLDLPLVSLSQAEIERLERTYAIEDILPLSPLQEGLLFHALYDAQGPDIYTSQLVLSLEGPLESETLQAAADALVQRHASLRAAFRTPEPKPAGADHSAGYASALAQHRSVVAG